ncbi:MAG: hypothetical protein HKL90_13625 [Elusimicrobia bacterium]|nr:hypothetical protein [Elusimicrobiota bacterium]
MTGTPDDFERLLERCRAQLDSISLSLPTLEAEGDAGSPPPPKKAQPPLEPPAPVVPAPAPTRPEPIAPAVPAAPVIVTAKAEPAAPPPEPPPQKPSPAALSAVERPLPPPPPSMPIYAPPAVEPKSRPPYSLDAGVIPVLTPSAPRAERLRVPGVPHKIDRPRADWRPADALAAAAVVAFAVWRLQRPAEDRPFELAASDAATLRPERADILVAQGSTLVEASEDGRTLSRKTLDAPVTALGWDRGSLWSVDGRARALVERRETTGRRTDYAVNYAPQTIALRGRQLWAVEPDGRTVHQYLVSRSLLGVQLQPLDQYQFPGLSVAALDVDDAEQLWVVDRASRRLYRLRKEGPGYRAVDRAPLAAFIGTEGAVKSIAVEDGVVWLLVSDPGGRATMHRLAAARLHWTGA